MQSNVCKEYAEGCNAACLCMRLYICIHMYVHMLLIYVDVAVIKHVLMHNAELKFGAVQNRCLFVVPWRHVVPSARAFSNKQHAKMVGVPVSFS